MIRTTLPPKASHAGTAGLWLALAALLAVAAVVSVTGGEAQARLQLPQNTTEPSVSGTAELGETLTGNRGAWTGGTITYAYAWLRCDASAGSCTPVANATSTTYSLAAADAGCAHALPVTASNADGPTTATHRTRRPWSVPPARRSARRTRPSRRTPAVDQRLSADAGTWSGEQPITFTFRWLRCDSAGNNCVEISGATDDQYTVKSSTRPDAARPGLRPQQQRRADKAHGTDREGRRGRHRGGDQAAER